MEPPRLITPPLPIDFALIGPTVVDSARLRERHVFPVVIDANVLIEDALHRLGHPIPTVRASDRQVVPHPKPSALSNLMAIHAIRVYGKPDLLDEVAEHMPRVANRKGHDPEAALALIYAEYVPFIRLVDPAGIVLAGSEDDLAAVDAIDPDDEPTARLSRLLDPSILLTLDRKALLRFGFGAWVEDPDMDALVLFTGGDWLKATFTLRNNAFSAQMEVGGRAVTITGTVAADATRKAISLARDNPVPTALLLGGVFLLWWMTRDSPFWGELKSGIARATTTTLTEIAARTEGRPESAARASVTLGAYLAKHASSRLPEAEVARTLAIAEPRGLSAGDLYHITGHHFAVLPILRKHEAFALDEEGRWHLGQPATSPGA